MLQSSTEQERPILLPSNLRYQNKLESSPARQYTSTVQPLNGTGIYGANTKCIINIPCQNNTVLVPSESYLKITLGGIKQGVAASEYIRMDKAGAHGIIQRIRVSHGSTLIEDIDDYGALASLMMALQQTSDALYGKQNILAGTTSASIVNTTTKEAYVATTGERLTVAANVSTPYAAAIGIGADIAPRTYALNLLSYIGSLSGSQYIPLFALTSAPLTLEIQFVQSALQFLCAHTALNTNSYTITDVEFVGTFIELSDKAIDIIRQSQMGEPLQYVMQQYGNIQSTAALTTAATSVSIPVAAKYASLKSLFCLMRTKADGAITYFPYSSEHYNLNDWRIRFGSQLLPSKAPNSIPEHFCELVKAIGSLSDLNHEPSLNMYNYGALKNTANGEVAANATGTAISNCFALGFDCESYSNADKSKIFTGMNTINSDIFWNLNFKANTEAFALKIDIFALYDQVIIFENGMCRVIR